MRLRLLLATLLLPLVIWATLPVGTLGQGKLDQRIDSTRAKIGRKKGAERVLTSDIAAYTRRIRVLRSRIGGLQRRQATLQADLERKRAELVRIQIRLRDERARLARLRARLVVVRRTLAMRLREMYQADKPDLLSVVLNSDGFAALLERGEFIARIAQQDRQVLELVRAAKRDAERTEARLDRLERRQQAVTAQVLARRNEVAMVKEQLVGTRVGYERTRAGKARALRKVRADRDRLEDHLDELEKEQAAVLAKLAAVSRAQRAPSAAPIQRGSGGMIWPVNGPITGVFGEARPGHMHAGVDIAAPTGTPIRAADGGRVVLAGWNGGYGQFTCIQHTASLSSCYAHQSRIGVSVGQSVSQGQVIGAVGNTGHSFGAHLHFETRSGGSPVNPMGYL